MQVALNAHTPAERENLGHRERVVHRRAEGFLRGARERGRQHLAANIDASQPEIAWAEIAAARLVHQLRQVAGIRAQQGWGFFAAMQQALHALCRRNQAKHARARPHEPADGEGLLHGGGGARADVDLNAVAWIDLVAEQPAQRCHGRPELGLVLGEPDLGRAPCRSCRARRDGGRGIRRDEVLLALLERLFDGDWNVMDVLDRQLGRAHLLCREQLPIVRRDTRQPARASLEGAILQVFASGGIGERPVEHLLDIPRADRPSRDQREGETHLPDTCFEHGALLARMACAKSEWRASLTQSVG